MTGQERSALLSQLNAEKNARQDYDRLLAICNQRQVSAGAIFWDRVTVKTEDSEPARCVPHERPSYLWGGDVCDLCDKDGNGTADALEPVGIGPNPESKSLFAPEEKGWLVVSGAKMERIPRDDPRSAAATESIRGQYRDGTVVYFKRLRREGRL